MKFEKLRWHDGNITNFELSSNFLSEPKIIISADLYTDQVRSPGRDKYKAIFTGVKRFIVTCDLEEVFKNAEAGSINSEFTSGLVFRLYLFGGFIEIEAQSCDVRKG